MKNQEAFRDLMPFVTIAVIAPSGLILDNYIYDQHRSMMTTKSLTV
jgi:hypothetical protein